MAADLHHLMTGSNVVLDNATATVSLVGLPCGFPNGPAAWFRVTAQSYGLGSRVTLPLAPPGSTCDVHVAGYNGNIGSFDIVVTEGSGAGNFSTFCTGCGGLASVRPLACR